VLNGLWYAVCSELVAQLREAHPKAPQPDDRSLVFGVDRADRLDVTADPLFGGGAVHASTMPPRFEPVFA
jgi:hypothetical protein